MQIDKIEVCEPIVSLFDYLIKNDCKIVKQEVSDYHFHEVYIKVQSNNLNKLDGSFLNKIERVNKETYSCSCHWSVVEIVEK